MGIKSTIGWTDSSWSPIRAMVKHNAAAIAEEKGYISLVQIATKMAGHVGPHCEHISPGCKLCYSGSNNSRCLPANGTGLPFDRRSRDLVDPFVDEKILAWPLTWKSPRRIFVENQSDLFGAWVPDEQIDRVFAVMALVMALSLRHTFQLLTKWPGRMLNYLTQIYPSSAYGRIRDILYRWPRYNPRTRLPKGTDIDAAQSVRWPLPNVWLGTSVEDQKRADERIPMLLDCPASVLFVSYEPALELVHFRKEWLIGELVNDYGDGSAGDHHSSSLSWIICGSESGRGARPFAEDWARHTRDACVEAGVAFFYKQKTVNGRKVEAPELDGRTWLEFPNA